MTTGARLAGIQVLILLALLAMSRPAQAAPLPSYPLDSLAFMSTAIVLVEKLSERQVDEYTTFATVRVLRTYLPAGPQPGDALEIDTSVYSPKPMFGWRRDPPPTVSARMVMFLEPQTSQPARPKWSIVMSGLRVFVDGKVYRYVQESNPGLYGPTMGEGPRAGVAFDRAGFESEIVSAIRYAAAVHTALAEPKSAARTRKLLDVVAPHLPAGDEELDDFAKDPIGIAIIDRFGNDHELDAMLDAVSRRGRVDPFDVHCDVPVEELVAAATDSTVLATRRVAALRLLVGMWWELDEKPALRARLVTLLGDRHAAVRRAALDGHFAPRP